MIKLKDIMSEELELSGRDYSDISILQKSSGINILRDKELGDVVRVRGRIVGGVWVSWVGGIFSFDVIVHPKYRNRGYGKELVRMALSQFEDEREAYGDAKLEVDAVNPDMEEMLKRHFGFIELSRVGSLVILGRVRI